MVQYQCPRCGYSVERKGCFSRHLKRKNICKPILSDITLTENIKNNLLKNQIVELDQKQEKDSQLKEMKELVEKLNEKLDKQENKIEELLLKNTGITNITNNTNNTIENLNIMILPYGDTDVSHLKGNDYYKALNKCVLSVPYLINKIHFDKNKPENHNIYIKNKRNDYIMVWDGKKWIVKDQTEVIDDIIRENEYRLEDWLEEGSKKFPKAAEKFKLYVSKRDEKGVPEMVRKEVKMMLYNNRDMIQEITESQIP